MKKLLTLFLSTLLFVSTLVPCLSSAQDATLPEAVETIEFDTPYWLEKGQTKWYRFEAPARQAYLTDLPLKQLIDGIDVLFGSDVRNTCYDADMNDLGGIACSNDPEIGDWTEFEPGETYYVCINATGEGQCFTLSPIKEAEPVLSPEKTSDSASTALTLKESGVERFIPGETESDLWDVYTLSEEVTLGGENAVYSSNYFVLPYRVYFDNARLITDSAKVTYSGVERRYAESWDALEGYTKKPFEAKENISDGDYVFSANHYSYLIGHTADEISAVREYDIYVPAGRKIVLDDGYIRAAEVDELYSDVKSGKWYSDAVLWCTENEYMNGTADSLFSRDMLLTRAQIVLILAKIDRADLSVYADRRSFDDVAPGKWYAEAVEWASENKITAGTGDRIFSPSNPLTRQELAVFLCAYGDLKGGEFSKAADLSVYDDAQSISSWARDAVSRAVGAGLIGGTAENILSPKSMATRAQVSLIIKNFCENVLPDRDIGSYFLLGGNCGYAVYDEIISLTGKENPNVLHIGMAATDPLPGYSGTKWEFGNRGCTADVLSLEDLESGAAIDKILGADIIYVDGGSSNMLLARLRQSGADAALRKAALNGTVMCGSSAGAICFGTYGTSGTGNNRFDNLVSTGCVPDVIVCPHGFEEMRVKEMTDFLTENPSLVGVAVDHCALEIHDGKFRIFYEDDIENVATLYWSENGEIRSENISSREWRPLSELMKK
ncbi:MAG: S-layer homology domain-containing protein [Clostridia bacterium]|nr:S-layer homology domain-containing protein [Clostridia bacterium]